MVTLLIGADNPEIFCTRDVRVAHKCQPIAVETPLGRSLLGPSFSLSTTNNFSTNFVRVTKDTVHRQIESFGETDFHSFIHSFILFLFMTTTITHDTEQQ